MNWLSGIAAGGLWPALPATGYWVLGLRLRGTASPPFPFVTSAALMTAAGMALWSVALLAAAIAGVYRPEVFGLAGWLLTGGSLIALARRRRRWDPAPRSGEVSSPWSCVLAAGLVVTAGFYLGFPTESFLCLADEGVYANHGIFIAHHGRLDLPYPWPNDTDPELAERLRNQFDVPGFYPTQPTITVQFAHLFPVWLAQAFATFGPDGLSRLNAVFGLLALAVYFGLCRTFLPAPFAVAATLFLALNPSEMWLARNTLSEILTQLFVWAGLLTLIRALQEDFRSLARWGGVFFGLAALVRIDGLMLLSLLGLSHLGHRILEESFPRRSSPIWTALYQTALPVFALAVASYVFLSRPYLLLLLAHLKLIGLFTAVSFLLLGANTSGIRQRLKALLTSPKTMWVVGPLLFCITFYAYWIRPRVFPDTTVSWSLVHLARYLSPIVVWGAVFGWFIALRQTLRKGNPPYLLTVLVITGAFSTLYLWRPEVEPFHFWAIRRFVPVIIPGFILFAAFGASWVLDRLAFPYRLTVGMVGSAFLIVFTVQASKLIFFFAENRGVYSQLQSIADRVPTEELVVAYGSPERLFPLYAAFDRKIIPMNPSGDGVQVLLDEWVASRLENGQPVYLLTENCRFVGAAIHQLYEADFVRSFVGLTWNPLPRLIRREEETFRLYRIDALSEQDFSNITLGNETVWGVEESGFYEQERSFKTAGNESASKDENRRFYEPLRWTNGAARLIVPVNPDRFPKTLVVNLADTGPLGTHFQVVVNGQEIFNAPLPRKTSWVKSFDLGSIPPVESLTIELVSQSFIPAEVEDSVDYRPYGVQVREIRLVGAS
jgi:hypothetical protein